MSKGEGTPNCGDSNTTIADCNSGDNCTTITDCNSRDGSRTITDCNSGDGDNSKETDGYTRKQKLILILCLTSQFFTYVGGSLPSPFLPKLDESHNIQSDITGWILGLLALTQLFLCPVFGKLVSYVSLHTMLVSGIFVCGGSTVLFGLLELMPVPDASDKSLDVTYLVLAIIVRIFQAIGSAAVTTAAMTYLTVTFTEKTTTVLSYSETVAGLGFMGGPAFGSGLFKVGGFLLVFCVLGGVIILVSLIVLFTLPKEESGVGDDSGQVSLKLILFNRNITISLLLITFTSALWTSIDSILEPELREKYGLTEDISALFFILLCATYAVFAPLVGKALEKLSCLNSLYVMVFGFMVHAINFMLMGPSPLLVDLKRPMWLLIVTLCIQGVGMALTIVPLLDMLSFDNTKLGTEEDASMDKSTRAMLSGLWASFYSFGDFLGPTFSGIVTKDGSFGWTMTYYAISSLVTALLIVVVKAYQFLNRHCKKHSLCLVCSGRAAEEMKPLLHNQ